MSFQLAPLTAIGAYWLDDLPNLSCQDGTRQRSVDGSLLSCNPEPLFEVLAVRKTSLRLR
jgi:hypothetical protein